MFVTQHKVPPLSPSAAADFSWPIEQVDATTDIEKFPLSYEFHDKEDVQEYSYGLWIQPAMVSPDQQQSKKEYMVIRLTTNSKEVQSDDQLAGDRTLLTLFQAE
jgi:protein transport protein SEC24